ncbi:MAG: OmpA family protein [Cyclobacteriaceae bacterium]
MENIFTDAQVSQYSLIRRTKSFAILLLLIITCLSGFAQKLSTENKKSLKKFQKAEAAVIDRDFRNAIDLFQQSIKIDSSFREPYLKLAGIYKLYQNKDSAKLYYEGYVKVTPEEKVSWKVWKSLAYLHFSMGEYSKADFAIKELSKLKPEHFNEPELSLLSSSIDFSIKAIKNPTNTNLHYLPSEVNQYQLQYFPVLTVDGGTLFYTKRDTNQPNSDEDIVFSQRSDQGWTKSVSVSKSINTELNEGACTISADGRLLIFTSCDEGRTYGSCDLFFSVKEGDRWTRPENMGSRVNSKYWDSQPALSGDGRTLYFSSNRPGGFGKRDLWSTRNNGRDWSVPKNLGRPINGFKDETTPFIHASNNALFYSSTSHAGMGGYDLFVSEKQNNIWKKPKNLGFPINSFEDEVSIFVSAEGNEAYYSKEVFTKGAIESSQIVRFDFLQDSIELDKSTYVTGVVQETGTGKFLRAELVLMNLNDSSDLYYANSDSVTGRYFLTVTENIEYGFFIDKKDYLFENVSFLAKQNSAFNPDTIDIRLRPIKTGEIVTLQNIYFDFNEYNLNSKSIQELSRIIAYLKSNPSIKFVIEGHTDNRGSDSYNLTLSQKRAEAVRTYLIDKGIEQSRLSAVGYGASQLVDFKEDETTHKVNRRIVFRVTD